jgi:hypothetical protein
LKVEDDGLRFDVASVRGGTDQRGSRLRRHARNPPWIP